MLKRSSSARRLTAAEVATSVHRQSGHQSFCASKEAVLRSKGTAVSRPTGARLLDVIRGDSFLTALGPACSREPRRNAPPVCRTPYTYAESVPFQQWFLGASHN